MNEIIYTLVATHITIVCVTLYLHRSQAHRAVTFHPVVAHFMRFWLWLTTGMVTKQWVAIHRKHHQYSDKPGDPHSPHVFGIRQVFTKGAQLYHEASKDKVMVDSYGVGTPADWMEHNVYQPHSRLGIGILLVLNTLIFGWWGPLIWGIQMIWIPFWAAGVVNGIAHWWGYRNGETRDQSRNISPWGIVIGGEELHNNHHLDPASARLSRRWFEFDIGWMYIKLFEMAKLAKLRVANP
jgi:stearoyl-CoA desaturase (delta-9 desaturase)